MPAVETMGRRGYDTFTKRDTVSNDIKKTTDTDTQQEKNKY